MFFLKIIFLKRIQSEKFISKICYILICTCLHISCSRNIGKFGSHKEKEKYAFDNRSQEKIGSMGTATYSCAICLEKYIEDDAFIKLECGNTRSDITHNFHKSCINKWINNKEHPICPVCRSSIAQHDIDIIKKSPLLDLFKAIENKDVKKVRLLVQNRPSIVGEIYNFKPINGDSVHCTPLHYAIQCNNVPTVREMLKCKNVNANKVDNDGNTLLHWATVNGNTAIIKMLLKVTGIDVTKQNAYGYTLLHWAASIGNTAIAQKLLKMNDNDVNISDENGKTPLYLAIIDGNTEIVRMLLKVPGINVNKADKNGQTPLHLVSRNNNNEVVKMLLKVTGIDVNKQNSYGYTPLHWAANNGHKKIIQMLLDVPDIDVKKKNAAGYTPFNLANIFGHTEIIQMLGAWKFKITNQTYTTS